MAATLLGYFRDNLKAEGRSAKYLNREFLAIFITEYNESHKSGIANYSKTATTRFYNLNSTSYCRFLELYNDYRKGIDTYNALAAIFNIK